MCLDDFDGVTHSWCVWLWPKREPNMCYFNLEMMIHCQIQHIISTWRFYKMRTPCYYHPSYCLFFTRETNAFADLGDEQTGTRTNKTPGWSNRQISHLQCLSPFQPCRLLPSILIPPYQFVGPNLLCTSWEIYSNHICSACVYYSHIPIISPSFPILNLYIYYKWICSWKFLNWPHWWYQHITLW